MLMCIQILVKFCPLVLKILSENEMVTDLRNDGMTEGQGKSNIAPLFQSGAIMILIFPTDRPKQKNNHVDWTVVKAVHIVC